MTAPAVDHRTARANKRWAKHIEEFEFMLGYGVTPAEAARRAGTTLNALRAAADRRGVTLPTSSSVDTIGP